MSDHIAEIESMAAAVAAEEAAEGEFIPGVGPSEPEQGGASSAEVVALALSVTFGILAARRGPHWKLSGEEAEQAGEAYGAVLDKYFPDMNTGPELAAVAVTAMLVLPRLSADRAAEEKREQGERARDGD